MRAESRWLCCAFATLIAACGGPMTAGDGGGDSGVDSGRADTVVSDGSRDVAVDTAGDASADVATDAATDVARDVQADVANDVRNDVAVDVPNVDVPPTDAPADAPPVDAGPPALCGAGAVVNLNTAGTRNGSTTTYTGSNATATPAPELPFPSCTQGAGAEVALAYTATAQTHLRVSTDNAGTDPSLDTVIWVLDACSSAGNVLGCNDDDPNATNSTTASTLTTTAAIPAGATVYIIVAGYDNGLGMPSTGTYQLTVTEVPEVANGAMCDPTGATNACAQGSSCITNMGGVSTCVANGSLGGACRADGTCDAGLGCNTDTVCVTAVAVGGACDPADQANVCATGSTCVQGAGANGTCVADGTSGGACRLGGTCDPGLTCSQLSTCLPTVAVGGSCDPNIQNNACATGSSCVQGAGGAATCVADGDLGGVCLLDGSCNAGLVCSGGFGRRHCVTAVAVGGACDPSGQTNGCVTGSSCVTDAGGNSTCVADGTAGGQCRQDGSCDAPLACSPVFYCAPVVPVGGMCDPNFQMNTCATGSTCVSSGTNGTCVADGGAGAPCLSGGSCNAGLTCDPTSQICVRAVADGGACDPVGNTTVCTGTTSTCVPAGSGYLCAPQGANNGECRTSTPACDPNLTCVGAVGAVGGYCKNVKSVGASCDPAGVSDTCAAGSSCVGTGATGTCSVRYSEMALSGATFVDACAMGSTVMLQNGDRDNGYSAAAITIPFAFRLFGTDYTSVWPSVNGVAAFGPAEPVGLATGGTVAIPDPSQPTVIAPMWEDLVLHSLTGTTPGNLCTAVVGAAPNQRFVIEWQEAYAQGHTATHLTFEIVLNQGSNAVDLIYSRLSPTTGTTAPFTNGTNATIGMQRDTALEYAVHTGTVSTAAAVRFTPNF